MKKNQLKWYHPFKLLKRNKELENLINTQFRIIGQYSDEIKEKEKFINTLKLEIKSLEEDYKAILNEIEINSKNDKIKKKRVSNKKIIKKNNKK